MQNKEIESEREQNKQKSGRQMLKRWQRRGKRSQQILKAKEYLANKEDNLTPGKQFNDYLKKYYRTAEGKYVIRVLLAASGFFESPVEDESDGHYLGRRAVGKIIVDNI